MIKPDRDSRSPGDPGDDEARRADCVIDLACDLIARASVTPEDAGCQQLIARRLLQKGFEAEWFLCGDVSNVLLTHGRGKPVLWFLGHTDVVPAGPESDWSSSPFEPEIRDGCLYGRGAADMKGSVAAMVVALERYISAHPDHPGQVGLLLTSDEEGLAMDGIRRVAQLLSARSEAPDFCLVGEPSSSERLGDVVRIGRRGSINAVLDVHGVQGHSAFPEKGDNPVHRLVPMLAQLTSETWDEGDDRFPPSHCQVTNLQAGTGAENVTPGSVRLMFNFRNGPASPAGQLRERLEAMLAQHEISRYQLDWRVNAEPFISEPGALRAAVRATLQRRLDIDPDCNTGGGTSDGRFISPLGSEVVELGPVNQSIHKVNEHVAIDQLGLLSRVYQDVLIEIFH